MAARCSTYIRCSACKVKIESVDVVGECNKCGLMVKMSKCTEFYTANIRVTDSDNKNHDLKMFHDVIVKLTNTDDEESMDATAMQHCLLSQPNLKFRVDRRNVVFSVNTV